MMVMNTRWERAVAKGGPHDGKLVFVNVDEDEISLWTCDGMPHVYKRTGRRYCYVPVFSYEGPEEPTND